MRIANFSDHSSVWRSDARRPAAPFMRRLLARVAALLIGGGALASASAPMLSAAHAADALPLHETGIAAAAPEDVGVDSRRLVALSRWIREQKLDVYSLLVVKDGKLIFERYGANASRDSTYELYSVTKAVTSLVAGILVEQGAVQLDEPVAARLAAWRPELGGALADKRGIELKHVLSMSSGLHYDFSPKDDPIYYTAPDRLKLAASAAPKVAPGTAFEYTDVNPILASAMLSAAAGEPVERYARTHLFGPLDMKRAAWERADRTGLVSAGWGLRLRAVDMAKIGMLVLDGGRWQGRQVVPRAWIAQMTAPRVSPHFGYYWWINNIVDSEPEFDAMGFKGQFITVLPKRNTVIVMTGVLPVDGGLRDAENVKLFRRMVNGYILPALDGGAASGQGGGAGDTLAALRDELEVSARTAGVPGTQLDPTDLPK
ncbi:MULTISPECIES: serine hydrolase [unclassified Burkholderia]|uniref:serine hydrolase domain-containing protein n=1 Tax=unclassified Burkholderia TaxID=2613784 RepID=UPI000F56DB6F|nr:MULTISPECIES: serine hydrolase [unclassified Burkholderia]RQR45083.1 class C beta-lactamase-related serine hydrolase [Burkholderia sp. Bp9131]RQR76924.1 class C beta-lactamase-related serine hydrolase [Burkholderia sp. Bp9015]RQR85843.1 class C beta-lactamase-related serine hydrolase [Burkholderia sp. Bp9011]RQR95426.1 class C beta-lactamase-related serine hydrolase [Burkholderia sp. Bp9010]RQS80033.1 class C beta-lactamase-related serine hydrolase [Burkholderia sp. Bp8977]